MNRRLLSMAIVMLLVVGVLSVIGAPVSADDDNHLVVIANSTSNLLYRPPNYIEEKTVMDVRGGLITGEYIILWMAKDFGLESTNNQAFNLIPDENEEYFKISGHPDFNTCVFTPVGSGATAGARLILAAQDDNNEAQWWKLLRQPDGSFIFVNKANLELCIAPTSPIPSSDTHNYLTLQPLSAANNTWEIDVMRGTLVLERPVLSVEPFESITVTEGADGIDLPASAEVEIEGLSSRHLQVVWDTSELDLHTPGEYELTGVLQLNYLITNPLELEAKVTVIVERINFTVRFVDWNGDVIEVQTVKRGFGAIAPTPAREGYTFVGWDEDFSNINEDLTVTALYEPNLVDVIPSAYVTKLNGNKNDLTITVTELYYDGSSKAIVKTFNINNNEAGVYEVGTYKVYVDTKGNVQIRACYIAST